MALRDRWEWFDKGAMVVAGLVLLFALFSRRLSFSRNLLFTALSFLALTRYDASAPGGQRTNECRGTTVRAWSADGSSRRAPR